MPRFHPLNSVETQSALARRVARLREWMMEPTPSPLPTLTERDHAARPWIAVLALMAFLGSQCVMPSLFMMDAAQAKEGETARVQKARAKANASKPAPAWYQAARRREAQQQAAMQKRSTRLAQTIRPKRTRGQGVATPEAMQQDEPPQQERRPGSIEGSKPGQVKPSEADDCKDCEVEMKALDLSRAPTEKELRMAGQLGGALSPIAPADFQKEELELTRGKAQIAQQKREASEVEQAQIEEKEDKIKHMKDINLSFGVAIQEWNKHNFRQAARLFEKHLKDHPDSPWAGEAQLHLGCDAKYNGRFSEAQETYDQLLQSTSANPKELSFQIHQKAKLRWADLDLALGRFDDAEAKLANIIQTDTDWRRVTWAQHWLRNVSAYKGTVRDLMACGTQSLSVVMASLGKEEAARELAQMKPTNRNGFSLAELERLAARYGAPMRGFQAKPEQLADLPTPFLIHYDFNGSTPAAPTKAGAPNAGKQGSVRHAGAKAGAASASPFRASQRTGHFLVVRSVDAAKRQVKLFDAQEGRVYYLSYADLGKEWSGSGLVLAQAKTHQAKASKAPPRLSSAKMKEVVGGCCGLPSAPGDLGDDNTDPVCDGCVPDPESKGEPSIGINRITLNMFVKDTPLWYDTPIGPDVRLSMSYNSQDATNQNKAFGNKWAFNYGSYLVEDTAAGGGRVTVFMNDGRQDNYTPNGSGGYTRPVGVYSTLVKLATNSYELRFQDGSKWIYGIPAGTTSLQPFLLETRDRFGYSLTFGYDANVRLTTITDALSKVTTLQYDGAGHIVRAIDPNERVASFTYDASGNMIEAVDMEGQAFQYTYDSLKRITQLNTAQGPWKFVHEGPDGSSAPYYPAPGSPMWANIRLTITDPMGQKEEYFYDGYYRKAWHVDKRNYRAYNASPNNGTGAQGTNSVGSVPKTIWLAGQTVGSKGRITKTILGNGDTENVAYDTTSGLPTSVTDARGKITRYTYNAQGRVSGVTDPKGHVTTINYAANDLDVASVTDALGNVQDSTVYDAYHQPIQVTNALSQSDNATYTAWGAVATTTDATGQVTTYSYDATSKQLVSMGRNGATLASYAYDASGRVRQVTDAAGLSVSYAYNNLDKVTKVTYPDGTYEATDYVCCGLAGAVTDRAGRKSYYDYDAMKRVARVQDAAGNSMSVERDAEGNVLRLLDSRGGATRWSYDALGRVTRKQYADGKADEYTYALGLLTQSRNPRGIVTYYQHDDNGNLTKIDYPTTPDVELSYDALNRVTGKTIPSFGSTNYIYDVLNRLTSIDGPFANDTVSYAYDNLGHRSGMNVGNSDGTNFNTSYHYDTLGRVDNVTSPVGQWTIIYTGNTGRLQSVVAPNGTKSEYSYDALQRLTQVQNLTSASAVLSQYGYTINNAKSIRTAMSEVQGANPPRNVSYTYDAIDQLKVETSDDTSTAQTNDRQQSINYDAMGNRTSLSLDLHPGTDQSVLYTHNSLNQVTGLSVAAGGVTQTTALSYDASGNMTQQTQSNGGSTYTYDDAERLTSLVQKDTTSGAFTRKSEYVYDGMSRKVISREYSWNATLNSNAGGWVLNEERRRIYNGMDVVQERDGTNTTKVNYTRGGNIGGLLARSDSTGNYFFSYDGSGNVVGLTNASQQLVAEYSYDAWGGALRVQGGAIAQANLYRYSTKELQPASGLYDYGFRFYSPSLGRWINRDPIKESGGLNLYRFVDNAPINQIDPYGLFVPKTPVGIPENPDDPSAPVYLGGGRWWNKDCGGKDNNLPQFPEGTWLDRGAAPEIPGWQAPPVGEFPGLGFDRGGWSPPPYLRQNMPGTYPNGDFYPGVDPLFNGVSPPPPPPPPTPGDCDGSCKGSWDSDCKTPGTPGACS